ncbi:MAG: hypothetical protein F6K47_03355 [Symploca sp. SIO2E6]|nr:hypothetical protein [Symploca sp. SIO2E6]
MNNQLVEALLQTILALPEAERHWLEEQLSYQAVSLDPAIPPMKQALDLIGLAATDQPPPTDEEVKVILEERLAERYLSNSVKLFS